MLPLSPRLFRSRGGGGVWVAAGVCCGESQPREELLRAPAGAAVARSGAVPAVSECRGMQRSNPLTLHPPAPSPPRQQRQGLGKACAAQPWENVYDLKFSLVFPRRTASELLTSCSGTAWERALPWWWDGHEFLGLGDVSAVEIRKQVLVTVLK